MSLDDCNSVPKVSRSRKFILTSLSSGLLSPLMERKSPLHLKPLLQQRCKMVLQKRFPLKGAATALQNRAATALHSSGASTALPNGASTELHELSHFFVVCCNSAPFLRRFNSASQWCCNSAALTLKKLGRAATALQGLLIFLGVVGGCCNSAAWTLSSFRVGWGYCNSAAWTC